MAGENQIREIVKQQRDVLINHVLNWKQFNENEVTVEIPSPLSHCFNVVDQSNRVVAQVKMSAPTMFPMFKVCLPQSELKCCEIAIDDDRIPVLLEQTFNRRNG